MPAGNLIDAGQVARFRADLEALTLAAPSDATPLGVAVSGGGDSLALLLLAHAAYPGAVRAATVDHGLRPAAVDEAALVARHCADLGVPHASLRASDRPGDGANLQQWARTARYRCLADWAAGDQIAFVATAHHRDDVAETFLMRAARGGGVRSLAAMPAVRALPATAALLVRPLLGWTRAALTMLAAAADLATATDPSNADDRFARARLRKLIAATPDLPPDQLARAATNLRDVEEAMEWAVQREMTARFRETEVGVTFVAAGLPFELRRRLAARAIATVRAQQGWNAPWRETALPDLVRTLAEGRSGSVGDVLADSAADGWRFRPAPPRRTRASPQS